MNEFWVTYLLFLVGSIIVFLPDIAHKTLSFRSLYTGISFFPWSNSFNIFGASVVLMYNNPSGGKALELLLGVLILGSCLLVSLVLEKKSFILGKCWEDACGPVYFARSTFLVFAGIFLSCFMIDAMPNSQAHSISRWFYLAPSIGLSIISLWVLTKVDSSEEISLRSSIRESLMTAVRRCALSLHAHNSLLSEKKDDLERLQSNLVRHTRSLSGQSMMNNISKNVEAVRDHRVCLKKYRRLFDEEQRSLLLECEIWKRIFELLIGDSAQSSEALFYLKARNLQFEKQDAIGSTAKKTFPGKICDGLRFICSAFTYPWRYNGSTSESGSGAGRLVRTIDTDDWPTDALLERFCEQRISLGL